MKKGTEDIARKAVQRLREYLADVPFYRWEDTTGTFSSSREEDWRGAIRVGDALRWLVIEAKSSGQPRIIRQAANELMRRRDETSYAIIAAPYISEAAARIATDAGIGYLDLAGNCRLCFDTVYIRRAEWPNPAAERRGLKSLYSPKAERVLRVLMSDPRQTWKSEPLAEKAKVSLGLVAKVKQLLEDREWLRREPEGFHLSEPAELLAEWSASYKPARSTAQDYFSLDPIPQIEVKLAEACQGFCDYALTGFSAAARMAPMVRYQRATAYITGPVEEVARRVGLKPVSSGANVSLMEPYDEGVLLDSKDVDDIRVTSAVQTYLDLVGFRGRGEEAAEAVLEQVIRPTW